MMSRNGHRERLDQQTLAALIQTTMRYPFRRWGFGEAIAMEALLAADGEGRRFAVEVLRDWADTAVALRDDPLAHITPWIALLDAYALDKAASLWRRARELADVLARLRAGQHHARIHRPVLAGWEHTIWVDCMHLDGPFLVRFAREMREATYTDLGAELLISHAEVLQDERSGLFSHGFDDASGQANQIHWGRGQGWALLGLVDTARVLPRKYPGRVEIIQRLDRLIDGLAATEAEPGRWATVVDQSTTDRESSVSAFVALGVGRAIAAGLTSAQQAALGDRAWEATLARITPQGELTGV